MIIAPEVNHHAPATMIAFYKKHFRLVHALHCGKCKNTIAIELSDPLSNDLLGLKPNAKGIIVLPVDEKLLSHRIRLDGMIGYQCACGNDTRASEIEERNSPMGDFLPHEMSAIHEEMRITGWQAPITHKNNKEYRGSFAAEKV